MITRLKESYSSDNVTSGDAISISWNKFFIEVKENGYKISMKSFKNLYLYLLQKNLLKNKNYIIKNY